MNISIKRSGGYAGLEEDLAEMDTALMSKAEAKQVSRLVQSLGFFDLPTALPGGEIGADFFRYEITITQDNRKHTVVFFDDDNPAIKPLRSFVETLIQIPH
jgi:hypothetical protein